MIERSNSDRIDNDAALRALHAVDFVSLLFHTHVLWMMPMPPWRAMVMAERASVPVTESMAALTIRMFRSMERVRRERTSASGDETEPIPIRVSSGRDPAASG